MAWGAAATAAIGAGASLLGGVGQAAATSSLNRSTQQWNEHMYQMQKDDSYKAWQMQNDYNSPQQQMQRLREANLNPNLVYGTGAVANSASAPKGGEVKSWNPEVPNIGAPITSAVNQYFDVQQRQAQLDNLKAQNTVLLEEAGVKRAQTMNLMSTTDYRDFNASQAIRLADTNADIRKLLQNRLSTFNQIQSDTYENETRATRQSRIQEQLQKVKNMRLSGEGEQMRNKLLQFETEMRKLGIPSNSPYYVQMLGNAWNQLKQYLPDSLK